MVSTTEKLKALEERIEVLESRLEEAEKVITERGERLADFLEFWESFSSFAKALAWIGKSTGNVFKWFIAFAAFLTLLKAGALDWLDLEWIAPEQGPD